MTSAAPNSAAARILMVCTGNICRSPYAERVLRQHLPADQVQVGSAGSGALVDHPIAPDAVILLDELGVDAAGHRARQLTGDLVREADLVLVLSREHRTAVVRLVPRALRTTFTILEVARLVELVDTQELGMTTADRVRRLPALLGPVRSPNPQGPDADDVTDPYLRGHAAFAEMAHQLDPALDALIRVVSARSGLDCER